MSHIIKDSKIYKGTSPGGVPLGNIKDDKIYKGASLGTPIGNIKDDKIYKGASLGTPIGNIKDDKIYKGASLGVPLNINSTIHSAIKDSKKYDLALMVAAYHFLIKPIF
jgi:hypothetical protein